MADQFCLRWNNFQTNIVNALDSLKCSEDLVDVTLTCEGKNIKAHKVILSACSPYFRNVFKENPCQHPVIILKDVLAEDIISLLSYMYQGEVFIEESKLCSFLHTAALLQVKGLTGVTQQRKQDEKLVSYELLPIRTSTFKQTSIISQKETLTTPNTSNKLYTQLTISSKTPHGTNKEAKLPTLKKRRNSTSDKPNDVSFGAPHKKGKLLETNDIYNNMPHLAKAIDSLNVIAENNNIDKPNDGKTEQTAQPTANGKNSSMTQNNAQGDNIPVKIKTERIDERDSPTLPSVNPDNDSDSIPDYENSMLARSLLSGINPSKSDTSANNSSQKKVTNKNDSSNTIRSKEGNTDSAIYVQVAKSPSKGDEPSIKPEKLSPKSDMEYEPEILLSEHQDGNDSEGPYCQEQSQALMLLAGMSNAPGSGASTSQGMSHQQSNHAAICGDCPHCGMKYSNQSALKYHVRLMHSDLTNRLCCYLCPRSFTMRETFKEHMWSTHGQRN